ncbi:MAG TPA: adenylate kinase [Terriglobia bacterium]|nr:adenylate kinase [Terriglobia bacterium]
MRAKALIFLGAPGAGKGTQAREISKHFGVPQISTGDILRDAVNRQTPLGMAAKATMDAGQLVPDDIVCRIVQERIGAPDCKNGFILDGFPRTLVQAEFVDRILLTEGFGNPLVVNIRVEQDLLIKRLTGRRTCSICGEIYNIYFGPPKVQGICDKDGGKLLQRADDNEATIRQRLVEYDNQTKPLIDHYRKKGLLYDVDGNGKPEEITRRLCAYLGGE